ncbi:hypothetical protein Bpro_1927 [Polaromonas sp. JS666]|nr:hypothetical protein Bpro_1927 [Polaromonas sp. JS666]
MKRPAQRGLPDQPGAFARQFVLDRLAGFEKDMGICLTPAPSKTRAGPTHAYFPALAACCGTLEYLSALYRGRINGVGWPDVARWAVRYLPQPDYGEDAVRVLVDAFRNAVAHRGIATGVWVDRNPGPDHGRRLTWKVLADSRRPSVRIVSEEGKLQSDPPWPCAYTHRVHIHLKSMSVDIREGAVQYAEDLLRETQLSDRFYGCMRQLYPQ